MLDLNMLSVDLDFMINDLPITITIDSVDYIGTKSDITKNRKDETGGYFLNYDLMIYLRTNDFTNIPEIGTLVTINAKQYRIDNIMEGTDKLGFIINLMKV